MRLYNVKKYIPRAEMIKIPEGRRYSSRHIWIEMDDEFIGRCGITEECLADLGYISFVDFPEVNMEIRAGEKVARLESDIDLIDLPAPVSGVIAEINSELETSPTTINRDPYGDGWIYRVEVKEPVEFLDLMDQNEYDDFLISGGDI